MMPALSDPETPPTPSSRAGAARHLLSSRQFRESIALTPQPPIRFSLMAGLQAALTGLVALPLIHLSSWSHLIGFASLGTLVALFGRFAPRARRSGIVLRCAFWQVFAVFAMSSAVWLGAPPALQLFMLALTCGLFYFVSVTGGFGPPGALIFVFAASASMGEIASFHQVIERAAVTGGVALLAWCICWVTEGFRRNPRPDVPLPSEPVRPRRHRLIAAAQIMVGTGLAAFAAFALGATHPGWAAMGALAILQGAHLHISMNRALQRMAGTVIGAMLVGLILSQSPSIWTVILLLTVFIVVTEVVIGANYGLGQILVTPMALLMTYLATAQSAGLVPERVIDTLIGAAIGMVFALLWSTLDDRTHLADHHARRARPREPGEG